MKIKQRFDNKFLNIKLANNRLRRVSELLNAEEPEKYPATNYDKKLNLKKEYPVVCLSYPLPSALADGQLGQYFKGFSHLLLG